MSEFVDGTVEVIRKDNKGFKIGDAWYSTYRPNDVKAGDTIQFSYEQKGQWNNVKGAIVKTGTAPAGSAPAPSNRPASAAPTGRMFPVPANHGDLSIIRQNSLSHATEIVSTQLMVESKDSDRTLDDTLLAERVISMAYEFEAYSTGQREVRAAKAIAEAMGGEVPVDE